MCRWTFREGGGSPIKAESLFDIRLLVRDLTSVRRSVRACKYASISPRVLTLFGYFCRFLWRSVPDVKKINPE